MITQAVLFAPTDRYEPGANGTRPLRSPATRLALLPVANKPLVLHAFDELIAAGIENVAVVSEPEVAEDVRALVEQRAGARRVTNHVVDGDRGFIEALHHAAGSLSDGAFVVHLCDSLRRDGLNGEVSDARVEGNDVLALVEPADSSVTPVGNGLGSQRAAGIYVFGPGVLDLHEGGDELPRRWDNQIASTCERLEEAGGHIELCPVRDCWRYHQRPDILLHANRYFLSGLMGSPTAARLENTDLQGPVVIDPTARLRSSTIRGPVVIGPNVDIRDAYVGPYSSIGRDCVIENAEVEHSIIMPGASIRHLGARLEGSVVGPNAQVFRDFRLPRAFRLNVGEGAEVALT
jgi:glucose-1-phosphate thymidylyltransferase